MKTNHRVVRVLIILSTVMLAFQNCRGISDSTGKVYPGAKSVDGNGGVYDGKLVGYSRLVPGYLCSGKPSAYARLDIQSQAAVLLASDGENCAAPLEVPLGDLEHSLLGTKYVGYKDGLFTYTEDLETDLASGVFTEAWCQYVPRGDTGTSTFEIAVEWQQAGDKALSHFYQAKNQPPADTEVERRLEIDRVSYFSGRSRLDIEFMAREPDSYKVSGTYSDWSSGKYLSVPVTCRMGGQFDPVAPQLAYPENFKTLAAGSAITDLKPSLNKPASHFTISPPLPEGLLFDSATGEITGAAVVPQSRQNYTVTAVFDFGVVARAVSLGVGNVYAVTHGASSAPTAEQCLGGTSPCTLEGAMARASAHAPLPVIIDVSLSTPTTLSEEISISGDVQIRGLGAETVFDGQSRSRHFSVSNGAILSLQDLTLKNGRAGYGGSVHADNSTLHVKRVVFEGNVAATGDTGQGGAIFVTGGNLSVTDSRVIGNYTPMSGGGLRGGAIHCSTSGSVLIARSEFRGNQSATGGAIYLNQTGNSIAEISNVVFAANESFFGSGIYLPNGNIKLSDALFENNHAIVGGGGLYARTNRLWVEKSQFRGNTAKRGSALGYEANSNWSRFYLLESRIIGNDLEPMILRHWPQTIGSALLFDGDVRVRGTILEENPHLQNCAPIYSLSGSAIISLGGNRADDNTCGF